MNRFAPLALSLLLLGLPSWGASALEASRSGAAQARAKVTDIRSRQVTLRGELNHVATRIEALKAEQKGALLPGGELESSLRRSQELSGLLSSAARELATADADAQRENLALLAALSQSLEELRPRLEKAANRDERRQMVTQMRALRAEREQVRAQLPAMVVPALEPTHSDNPEELLEQADALRDSEDKVRQRMDQLKSRVHELREEHELDRRMNDFLGEEAMFDEQDRRLRLSAEGDSKASDFAGAFRQTGATPQTVNLNSGGANSPGSNASPGPNTNAPPPQNTTSGQSARVAGDRPVAGGVSPAAGEGDDLKSLEAQLGQLDSMARELEQKARQMEQRAKQLQ